MVNNDKCIRFRAVENIRLISKEQVDKFTNFKLSQYYRRSLVETHRLIGLIISLADTVHGYAH